MVCGVFWVFCLCFVGGVGGRGGGSGLFLFCFVFLMEEIYCYTHKITY